MIKSRKRMGLAGYLACMREKMSAYRLLIGKSDEKRQLGKLDVDGKRIL
jgi:hypothetical protein